MATAPEQKIGPLTTSKIAAAMVAEVESDLPLLMHANKSVQKPFETAGDGTVMDVIVPEMPTVGDGAWINEGDPLEVGGKGNELDYSNHAVPVTLKQKHVAFGIPSALEFASIEDMENLVTKPYGSTLASAIQTEVAEAAMNGASFSKVLSSTGKFPEVAQAISGVRKARAYGKLYGVVGSDLNGALVGEGINYFNPQNNISDIWKSARLGEYSGAEWFTTPDINDIVITGNGPQGTATISTAAPIQSVVKGKKLFAGQGEYAWVQLTTGSLVRSDGSTVDNLKEMRWNISGVYVADIFGNKTSELYTFKAVDLKVEDVSGTDYAFLKVYNPGFGEAYYVGGDNATPSLVCTLAIGTYHRGIIYAQNSLCVAFGRFAKPANAQVAQYSGQNGVTIRTTSAYQVMKDRNVTRWDTLVGAALARPNWACELLVKA